MFGRNFCMTEKYWFGSVHRKAWQETRELLRIETRARLMMGIVTVGMALAVVWLMGEQETARSEILVRVALSAVILLAFPFVYVWEFIRAPSKLHYELEQENIRLKSGRAVLEVKLECAEPYSQR
jgi:hypothetical protein